MVTYHFIVFFETVLGREHSGKVSKRLFGTFNFGGKTLSGHLPFLGSTTKNIAFVLSFPVEAKEKEVVENFDVCPDSKSIFVLNIEQGLERH